MWKPDKADEAPPHVIVIEKGNPATSRLWRLLAEDTNLDVAYAATWEEVEGAFRDCDYDVAIIHGGIAEDTAFGVNERLKSSMVSPPATILLCGQLTTAMLRKAFRIGFSDCISEVNPVEEGLSRSIAHAVSVTRAARLKQQAWERLERQAQRDGLTGLPNCFHLQERLNQIEALASRRPVSHKLILFRIMEAADIAARFGFHTAEKIVYSCAAALRDTARTSDDYGRLDFDTFYYLVDNSIDEPHLKRLIERLSAAMAVSVQMDALAARVSAKATSARFPRAGMDAAGFIEALQARLRARAGDGSANHADQAAANEPPGATGNPPAMPVERESDRRSLRRRRVYKQGALVLNNGFSTVNCTIRDVSDGGARVEADSQFVAPDQCELLFVESGRRFAVRKRWQSRNQIGLEFVH